MLLRRVLLSAFVISACAAHGQGAPPPAPTFEPLPPGMPAPAPAPGPMPRLVQIPSAKSPAKAHVQGKLKLEAQYRGPDAKAVAFFIDAKEIGRVLAKPYLLDWDSTGISDGVHVAKWSALGATGQELGSGSLTIIVGNQPSSPYAPSAPSAPSDTGIAPMPAHSVVPVVPPPAHPILPTVPPPGHPLTLTPGFTTYTNAEYGIRIEHPIGWTVKNETKNVEKDWVKGYWLVFSTDPIAKAQYVVNLRHRLADKDQTPEGFAKTDPYVLQWTRTIVNGRPAFTTTAGSPSSKRVVHRMIVLGGQHVWMFNLMDTSGKPAGDSREVFMRIVNSLSPIEAMPGSHGTPALPRK